MTGLQHATAHRAASTYLAQSRWTPRRLWALAWVLLGHVLLVLALWWGMGAPRLASLPNTVQAVLLDAPLPPPPRSTARFCAAISAP